MRSPLKMSSLVPVVLSCIMASPVEAVTLPPGCLQTAKLLGHNRPLEIHEINQQTFGKPDRPPLIAIHGVGSAHQTFLPIVNELSQKFFVITPDLRGHGNSSGRGSLFTNYQLARDLDALFAHYRFQEAHLLGHSYGGRIALAYTFLRPKKVLSLTLEDVDPRREEEEDPNTVLVSEVLRSMNLRERTFQSREEAREVLRPYFDGVGLDYLVDGKLEATPQGFRFLLYPHAYNLWLSRGGQDDLSLGLSQILAPVLHIRGDHSAGGIPLVAAQLYNSSVKNLHDVEVTGAAHRIHTTRPADFSRHFLEFQSR